MFADLFVCACFLFFFKKKRKNSNIHERLDIVMIAHLIQA
jgi:hypothetical protein